VKDRQEYLRYLLEQKKLTSDEEEWLLNYLEGKDISEIERIAAEEFEADIAYMKKTIGRKQSEYLLKSIHARIEAPRLSMAQIVYLHRFKILVAALVIMVFGAALLLGEKSSSLKDDQNVLAVNGNRRLVKLPDGSKISVEPSSRFSYPKQFGEGARNVYLTGEAFFEVTHDAAHPFIVHTPHANVMVLGTSFNVEANASGFVRVVVSNGRVKVQTTGTDKEQQAVIINASQSVVYNNATNEIQKIEAPVDAVFYRQRHNGKFSYEGVPVAKVAADIERYYHVPVSLEENLNGCAFYGQFRADDNVERAISLITLSLNASMKKNNHGKGYIISGGTCR